MFKRLIQLHLAALVIIVTSSWSLASARLQDDGVTSQRTSDHFLVICHFKNDQAAEQAIEAVEEVWTTARKFWGLPPKGRLLLTLHLYRTFGDYEAVEDRLHQGKFRDNLCFTDYKTQTAHVALQPPLDDKTLERVGLPVLTRRLLAHEAAHLVRLFYMDTTFEHHPDWLTDGSASWFDAEVMKSLELALDDESDPWMSDSIVDVQRLLATGTLPTAEEIFKAQIDEPKSFKDLGKGQKYSLHELFFRFLMESEHQFGEKLLSEARRTGGGPTYKERFQAHVDDVFKSKEVSMAALDEMFRDYISRLEPEWEVMIRSLERRGDDWLQCAFADTYAVTWRTRPVDRDEYTLSGNIEILPTGGQQLSLLLDRSDSGFISVAFSREGYVTVFNYDATKEPSEDEDSWIRLEDKRVLKLRRLDEFAFEVHVDGLELTVSVEGRKVLKVDLPRKLTGPWGLGAYSESVGFWRNLKIARPLNPR